MPATPFVALLRAVNVGGTGKLAMSDLKSLCEKAGFKNVRTYIASGNVLFDSTKSEKAVKKSIEGRLLKFTGKPAQVAVRTGQEMAEVLAQNPFPTAPGNRTVAIFLDSPPSPTALDDISGFADEELRLGKREIYVKYGADMGHSKLKIPFARQGTARNMNTIAKLAELANRGK